ncbi:MAG: segregation and condensation protein A [Janthinobacterium lividum]
MTGTAPELAPNAPIESPEPEAWEDPPRRPAATMSPVLSVVGFEGPLDWLLEMVRARKIDLARLSILALVEAFGEAMDAALTPGLPAQDLARWASWTVMAAQLTELRARLMLPADVPDGQVARAEAEALRQHWISRAEMAKAADWLARRPQLGRDVFVRGQPEPAWEGQGVHAARATATGLDLEGDDADGLAPDGSDDLTELLRACLVALRLPSHMEAYRPRHLPFWSVSDATRRIRQMMPAWPEGVTLDVFLPERADDSPSYSLRRRAALAATLIAGLELARGGALTLKQDVLWQPIHVA